jgi:hypothetical protein
MEFTFSDTVLSTAGKKRKYLELYNAMFTAINIRNPCNICKNQYGKIECLGSLSGTLKHTVLCCQDCKHHSVKKGCKVKSLGCVVFLCADAYRGLIEGYPGFTEFNVDFLTLKEGVMQEMRTYDIPAYPRCSMKENFAK